MFKFNMKKALALLASVLMLCSLVPMGALFSANADDNNVVVNGGFENGDSNWSFSSGTHAIVNDAHSGSGALSLTNPGLWASGAEQTVSVSANSEYTITWYSKRAAGSGVFNLYVMNANGYANLASVSGQNWMNEKSGNWVKNQYVVNTGDATSVILKWSTEASNPGTILLDDIVMAKSGGGAGGDGGEGGDSESTALLAVDFNDGTSGFNQGSIVAEGPDGSKCLKWSATGGWGCTEIMVSNVKKSTDYVAIFKAKANIAGAMGTTLQDGNWGAYWNGPSFNVTTSWKSFEISFNSANYVTSGGKMLFKFQDVGVAMDLYVDDLYIYEKGSQPDTPDTPDVPSLDFANGDFETGDLTGWTPWQNTQNSAAAKKNGSYGAVLKGDGSWGGLLDKTFAVESGKTYTLTFWHKAVSGGANFVVKDNGAQIASYWGNKSEWTQFTLEFTPNGTELLLNICGGGDGIASEIYVDDFVLAVKAGGEPDVPDQPDQPDEPTDLINGDFEDGDNGWSIGPAGSIVDTAHKGTGALRMENPSSYAEVATQTITVLKNTSYEITWYAKRVEGKGAFNLILMNDNGNYSVEGQAWMNETSGDWVKYHVLLNTGNESKIFFKFTAEAANAGVILIDDVSVIIEGSQPVDPSASLIKNGSFEEGRADWSWGGESAVVEGDFYEGAHSAKLVNNTAWGVGIEQTVKLQKNTDYVIRFYTKRVTGKGVWMFSLMDADTIYSASPVNLDVTSGQKWFDHTTTNKWEEHVLEFNTGDVEKVLVKWGPEGNDAGSYLIDYIGLWTKGYEPSPDDPDSPVVPPKADMFMTSFGVLNNRPYNDEDNMLTNGSFESTTKGEWVTGWDGDTVSVVKDSTTLFGKKSLYFNTAGIEDETKLIFWVDVEPDTAYVFSTWLKGAYLADDNRGLATVGIVNENGKFLSMYQENDITRFLNGERQIVPTAWDDEWHLRGIEFNSGECTQVGIALAGKNSQMWVDDMALFKVGNGKKYMSPNAAGSVALSYSIDDNTCKDKDSLIPDPTFSKGSNDFWKSSYGWKNGFLTFAKNKYEYGTSLKYTASGDNAPLSIIKTIEVEPNTEYTFSVDLKILEDGWGKLMLCDGKKREPLTFLEVSFDSYDYDPAYAYYGWYTTVCKFNTDVYDKISLVIVDDGGEALLDNMRLYKSEDGSPVTDKFVVPPEEPKPEEEEPVEDDWYEEEWYEEEWYEPIIDEEPIVEEEPPVEEPDNYDDPVVEPDPVPDELDAPVATVKSNDAWIWIAIGGGAALLAGAGVFLFFFLKKKKTPTPPAE